MAGPGYDPDPMVAKLNLPDAKPYKSDPKTICSSSEDMLKALTAYQADIDKMTAALKQNISKPKNERLKYTLRFDLTSAVLGVETTQTCQDSRTALSVQCYCNGD